VEVAEQLADKEISQKDVPQVLIDPEFHLRPDRNRLLTSRATPPERARFAGILALYRDSRNAAAYASVNAGSIRANRPSNVLSSSIASLLKASGRLRTRRRIGSRIDDPLRIIADVAERLPDPPPALAPPVSIAFSYSFGQRPTASANPFLALQA
jgi:hypothetical protein